MRKAPKIRKTSSSRGRRRGRNVVMPPTLRYRSDSNSASRNRKRVCTRLRMRPWLEGLLNRDECSILKWEDRDKKCFSIAWRHASSHGFDQSQHGDLFYMWAHHTGKLTEDNCGDHSNNKSTFRCALHSLKDCIELTKKGDKRGEGAKRTYQFINMDHQLYDRKRKGTMIRRNTVHVKEENSDSGFDFIEHSTDELACSSTEENVAVMSLATSSPDVDEQTSKSSTRVSRSVCRDIKRSPLPTSSPETTNTFSFAYNSSVTDNNVHEQCHSNFQDFFIPSTLKSSQYLLEAQHDDNIPLELQPLSCRSDIDVIECKLEPMTPSNVLTELFSQDHPDTYEATNSIYIPKLNCGGKVKVHKDEPETSSNPEFQIDCSVIQALIEQQQRKCLLVNSLGADHEFSSEVSPVAVIVESVEFQVLDGPTFEDTFYTKIQDQDQRVLTELQPLLNDASLAAMEAESDNDMFSDMFCPADIFSVGAC